MEAEASAKRGAEPVLSREELYEADFPWTVIDGRIYAIGAFMPEHPGGRLICRAIGEDSSHLFHSHHSSAQARKVLRKYLIGRLPDADVGSVKRSATARPFQDVLNARIAGLEHAPTWPWAELVAAAMLSLFCVWCALAYGLGWWKLNVALSWFWWRHLDAGLHSAAHGDFRHRACWHRRVTGIYGLLSYKAVDYYCGDPRLRGCGLSKHLWHHLHTNNPRLDPDWATMSGEAWVRRHESALWRAFHVQQVWYWLPATGFVEPLLELVQRYIACLEALAALLEPPFAEIPWLSRLRHAGSMWAEVLLNPGYQGLALLCQPCWRALAVLLAARAVARMLLFPFSEVQHYMPEHLEPATSPACEGEEEWAITQLRTTANLRLGSYFGHCVDFLMFHGDTYQIEHHLWPAMSFVNLPAAARIVRAACAEFGVPYYEIGYWEGYARIWRQVREHAAPPGPPRVKPQPLASSQEGPGGARAGSDGAPREWGGSCEPLAPRGHQRRKRARADPPHEASGADAHPPLEDEGVRPRRRRRRHSHPVRSGRRQHRP